MLTYPAHYFKTDKFEDIHIQKHNKGDDKTTKFFGYQLEQEIYISNLKHININSSKTREERLNNIINRL